jgi:hypothetical protein
MKVLRFLHLLCLKELNNGRTERCAMNGNADYDNLEQTMIIKIKMSLC